MVKVAILRPVNMGYERLKLNKGMFDYYKIKEELKDYVSFVDVKNVGELFITLHKALKHTPQDHISINDFYYNDKYLLQSFSLAGASEFDNNFNMLASQLNNGTFIIGSIVIVKRQMNNKLLYEDIKIDDIIESIIDTFIHKGVIIKPNDNVVEFDYIFDVLEWTNPKETDKNIRYHEFKFLDHILIFYVNINTERTPENLNKQCSLIYGQKIYGEVLLGLRDTHDSVVSNRNMTIDLFKKIVHLFTTVTQFNKSKYTRTQQKGEELKEDSKLEVFPHVTYFPNFFYIIENEYESTLNDNKREINYDQLEGVLNDVDEVIKINDNDKLEAIANMGQQINQ